MASKQPIIASPPETCAIASIRAVCTRSSPRAAARWSMTVVPLPQVMVGPEEGLGGLFLCPGGTVEAAKLLDLLEVLRILLARQAGRTIRPELRGAAERERPNTGHAQTNHRSAP